MTSARSGSTAGGCLSWVRSLLAVAIGYVTILALTMTTFLVFGLVAPDAFDAEQNRVDEPWQTLIAFLSLPWAIAGGYVTASIAPRAEIAHCLGLAGLLLAMWIVFVVTAPSDQSSVYQTVIQLGGVLGVFVGGTLRVARRVRLEKSGAA